MATPITKNKKTIDTQMVKVDAKTAQTWLDDHNTHNRNVRAPHVLSLARDMAAGRWSFNGAPIVFADDGTLLDGQHRLAAVVKSKSAIPFLVIRGVDANSQHTMDTGSRRSAADAFTLAGKGNNASRATAVGRFALIIEGKVDGDKVSTAEIFEYLDKNPLILDCIETTRGQWTSSGMTPRVFDYCYWRLSEVDREDAAKFFKSLHELTGLPVGSPITTLHKRLMATSRARKQLDAEMTVSLVFRAWNYWREGREITKLPAVGRTGSRINIPVPA